MKFNWIQASIVVTFLLMISALKRVYKIWENCKTLLSNIKETFYKILFSKYVMTSLTVLYTLKICYYKTNKKGMFSVIMSYISTELKNVLLY